MKVLVLTKKDKKEDKVYIDTSIIKKISFQKEHTEIELQNEKIILVLEKINYFLSSKIIIDVTTQ